MIDLLRVATALVMVFGLLGLLYLFSNRAKAKSLVKSISGSSVWPSRLRSFGSHSDSESVRVLSRTALTANHQLHLLRVAKETYLICTHANGCTLLRASGDEMSGLTKPESTAVEGLKRYVS